jgi:hypothetical protein
MPSLLLHRDALTASVLPIVDAPSSCEIGLLRVRSELADGVCSPKHHETHDQIGHLPVVESGRTIEPRRNDIQSLTN